MKIGIITNAYPPNLNGVSVAVYNLQKALEAKGAEVFIVTPSMPQTNYPENVLPLPSAAAPKYTSSDLRIPVPAYNRTVKFFKQKGVDIIHTQDTFMGGIDGSLIAARLGIPAVHTYHTLVEDYQYFKFPGYKRFVRSYSQLVCNSHNAVISLSEKIESYLNQIGVLVDIRRLPNVYLPPEADTITPTRKSVMEDFIKAHDLGSTFNFICFGRVAKEKNILATINTVKETLFKHPHTRLIIAGDGPQTQELKDYVMQIGLLDKVIFYGPYSRCQMALLASYCKAFVVTSVTEVLPTTPLEAMSWGLPVLAVNDLAYTYIVKDSENGYWRSEEDLSKCCQKIVEDKKLLEKLSKNALKTADNYIKRDIAGEYLKLYQELIDCSGQESRFKSLITKSVKGSDTIMGIFTKHHL
jgi:1,2-diacylglycerol 3-alpha-glucosyltransferase